MPLTITPVYKSLHTRILLMGLEIEDFMAVLGFAIVMNFLAHFVSDTAAVFGIPLNLFMELVVPLLAVPVLMVFKYGRPRGYLQDFAKNLLAPRAWCALERDSVLTTPYIREEENESD